MAEAAAPRWLLPDRTERHGDKHLEEASMESEKEGVPWERKFFMEYKEEKSSCAVASMTDMIAASWFGDIIISEIKEHILRGCRFQPHK